MTESAFLTTSEFFPQKSEILEPFPLEDKNRLIMNSEKYKKWRAYIRRQGGTEKKAFEDMRHRYI